jgi:hypothetical protein
VRLWRASAATVCALAGADACTLLVDTGGLVPARAGARSDAGIDGTFAEAGTADARAGEGGPGDAGDAAPPGRFCAQIDAGFCDDFDDGPTLRSAWTPVYPRRATLDVRADAGAVSAPHVLFVQTQQLASGDTAENHVNYALRSAPTRTLRVAFDVRIDQVSRFVDLTTFYASDPLGRFYFLQLGVDATTFILEEYYSQADGGNGGVYAPSVPAPPLGTWVRCEIRGSSITGLVELLVNGQVVISRPGAPESGGMTSAEIHVGIDYADGPGRASVAFDNVVIDYE